MSNVALFNKAETVDLSYLKGVNDTLTATISGGTGGKRISIKGGFFRMMVAGQEVATAENRYLNIVFVDASPNISRTYYKGTYQEGVTTSPECWSDDGMKPDSNCEAKQASNCVDCPMNIKGSGQGDSKACRYSQRFAVVLEDDLSGDVYNLTLPSTSIFINKQNADQTKMSLQQYTRMLAGHGLPISAVVTKMAFDVKSSTPKMIFSADRPLTEEEYKIAVSQRESYDAKQAIAPINYASSTNKDRRESTDGRELPKPNADEPAVRQSNKVGKPKPTEEVDINAVLADWA